MAAHRLPRLMWPFLLGTIACLLGPTFSGTAWAEDEAAAAVPLRYYENRGGDFSLTDTRGGRTGLADFRGYVVLMTFGYTNCPDICPATLVAMKQTLQELGPPAGAVRVIFVTLDPERDTSARLAAYLPLFDSAFVGLTGTDAEIRAVARQYRVKYEYRDSGTPAGRQVDHSAFIYLVDAQGRLRYLFPHTSPPEFMAAGVLQLLAADGK